MKNKNEWCIDRVSVIVDKYGDYVSIIMGEYIFGTRVAGDGVAIAKKLFPGETITCLNIPAGTGVETIQ